MSELVELLANITALREQLNHLVARRDLRDPEILRTSQMLDAVLTEYQKMLTERTKRK